MKCLLTTILNGTNFIKRKHELKESSSGEKIITWQVARESWNLCIYYFDFDWTLQPILNIDNSVL
jgi:hypothetical protein